MPPHTQVRVHDFQNVSLKMLALRLLKGLPQGRDKLVHGVYIPGEFGSFQFNSPVKLFVCPGNCTEAWSVAEDMRDEAACENFTFEYVDHDKPFTLSPHSSAKTALLVYMNKDLFCDGGLQSKGSVAYLVHEFMKLRVRCCHMRVHLLERYCLFKITLSFALLTGSKGEQTNDVFGART